VEFYLALKEKESLTYAATWINLENLILNESASHRRTNNCMISFTGDT
jgi:hypothetical protein